MIPLGAEVRSTTILGAFFLLVSVPSAIAAIKLERRFSTRRS